MNNFEMFQFFTLCAIGFKIIANTSRNKEQFQVFSYGFYALNIAALTMLFINHAPVK